MSQLAMYRKRLIPEECILLRDDKILHIDSETIVTSWNTIRPKKDLHHGFSVFYRNEGWKVSRFYTEAGKLLYTYCDIVCYEENLSSNELTVVDLLADVIIYPDGFVKVVDLDELAEAVSKGLITSEQLNICLINLNALLERIYKGELDILCSPLDKFDIH